MIFCSKENPLGTAQLQRRNKCVAIVKSKKNSLYDGIAFTTWKKIDIINLDALKKIKLVAMKQKKLFVLPKKETFVSGNYP